MGVGVYFQTLQDPRQKGKITYPLEEILLLVLCAVLSGAEGWTTIALYGEQKQDFLRRFLSFKAGTPSHDQLGKLFSALDSQQFQHCFQGWVESLQHRLKGVIAIDGKVLRRSFDKAGNKAAITMVSAWSSEQNLVLAQTAVDKKSNEITAIPKLLDMLTIQGAIVSIDAMGCQRDIGQKIINKKGDYILALKGNQSTLHRDVVRFFDIQAKEKRRSVTMSYSKANEKTHGRHETRSLIISSSIDWLQKRHDWPGLKTVIKIDYTATLSDGKQRADTRYYLSSLPADAQLLAKSIRSHWGIENGLHWVMDMVFRDDECSTLR